MATDPTPRTYHQPNRTTSDGRQVLQRSTLYPIADEDRTKARAGGTGTVRAVWTGETRPPKRGEWYLSGALIEAYKAVNDLSTDFAIAKLVRAEPVTRWVEVEA